MNDVLARRRTYLPATGVQCSYSDASGWCDKKVLYRAEWDDRPGVSDLCLEHAALVRQSPRVAKMYSL